MIHAAVVTPCKGRLNYLQQCLPSWLAQDCLPLIEFSIYVVDYGCPDGAADWCVRQDEPRLTTVRVHRDTEFFNLSRARNIGMRRAVDCGAEILAVVDADMQLPPHFLRQYAATMLQNQWELCKILAAGHSPESPCFFGTCVVTSRMFNRVRGYDESLNDYGHEDTDFYWRCERTAPEQVGWLPSDLTHLPGSEEDRVRFYREKNKWSSIEKNFAAIANRDREVNARDWGQP